MGLPIRFNDLAAKLGQIFSKLIGDCSFSHPYCAAYKGWKELRESGLDRSGAGSEQGKGRTDGQSLGLEGCAAALARKSTGDRGGKAIPPSMFHLPAQLLLS